MTPAELNPFIKATAATLGIPLCGMTPAVPLPRERKYLEQWLHEGRNGSMFYMSQYTEKRTDPTLLLPGSRTIISVGLPYAPNQEQDAGVPRISRYAFGRDYHVVLKDKLHRLLHFIREAAGPVDARVFVDTAPVLERVWAARSGLGWIGKNGLLINSRYGSYLFLGEIIMDLEAAEDTGTTDRCGTCTRCLEACPVSALTAPGQMDARRCLSYLTIEHREPIMPEQLHQWMFGCDICQEVCPWNRQAPATTEHAFEPIHDILHRTREQWLAMDEVEFERRFRDSPLWRPGLNKLKNHLRNQEKG